MFSLFKIKSLSIGLLLVVTMPLAAAPMQYYLPQGATYNKEVITPEQHLGYGVGEFHARYDQVVSYLRYLANQSDRAHLIAMGNTWEQRPQILLAITSEKNQLALQKVLAEGKDFSNDNEAPLVVWLGYSIHGNEASGTNASLLTAYHLTALDEGPHGEFLDNTIVLIDPSFNPDGYGRFSTWVNSNRSKHLSVDPMDREHNEDWPNGRTNHYRFDLNRDWLLAQQKESRNRLKWFHYFHPNVLGDFHEMGTNNTYFFQPGVPSRQNPLTPDENFQLTDAIAKYHAKALDNIGSLYYSKQNFDDFYYGKGSTYPDIQGSVGILFEQASSRGHAQESVNGPLRFSFAVRNQFTTSLSTLAGAYANKENLKKYRENFFNKSAQLAAKDPSRGLVISDAGDSGRLRHLTTLLSSHQIEAYRLAEPLRLGKTTFKSGIVIPYQQKQYRLIKAMFETRTEFENNTFYDVSTWNIALAFNLNYQEVAKRSWSRDLLGESIAAYQHEVIAPKKAKVAYVMDWGQLDTAKAVNQLLEIGVRLRMARKPFRVITAEGNQQFPAGSILVPTGIQAMDRQALHQTISDVGQANQITIDSVMSGYALDGIDMGSPDLVPLKPVRPMMLTGSGVSAYDSGEIWHFLDNRLGMPLTQVKLHQFDDVNLNRYSHVILAHGNYDELSEKALGRLTEWVEQGGVVIGIKRAAQWLSDNKLLSATVSKTSSELRSAAERRYSDMDEDNAQRHIGGSIFQTQVDLSHPLAFGIGSKQLPVFKNHRYIMTAPENPYQTVISYSEKPLLSGYISGQNLSNIANTPLMTAERLEKGSVIAIMDNPVFRAYWYGTSRLLINGLFFGTAFEAPNS